jgi:streptogramin lyase
VQLVRSFCCHSGAVNAVAVSPDGRFLYTGNSDSSVTQLEPSTGKVRSRVQ